MNLIQLDHELICYNFCVGAFVEALSLFINYTVRRSLGYLDCARVLTKLLLGRELEPRRGTFSQFHQKSNTLEVSKWLPRSQSDGASNSFRSKSKLWPTTNPTRNRRGRPRMISPWFDWPRRPTSPPTWSPSAFPCSRTRCRYVDSRNLGPCPQVKPCSFLLHETVWSGLHVGGTEPSRGDKGDEEVRHSSGIWAHFGQRIWPGRTPHGKVLCMVIGKNRGMRFCETCSFCY